MRLENQSRLTRYLLGDLPRQEREQLEEEYFTSDEAWETLNAVEDDLIHSYVRGELSPVQRDQFERHFLGSAKDRERVELAKILLHSGIREQVAALDRPQAQATSARSWIGTSTVKWASAAAGMAAAALLVLLLVQNQRLRRDADNLHRKQVELQRQNDQLQQQVAAFTKTGVEPRSGGDAMVSLLLTPGLLRNTGPGSENNVLKIPAKVVSVMLLLDLRRDEFSQYDVAIRTVEGSEIERVAGLKSEPSAHAGRAVALRLPARVLPRGDYIIKLYGQNGQGKMETLTPYSLSVVR